MTIDAGMHDAETTANEKKEVDFFEEHTNNISVSPPTNDPLHFSSNLKVWLLTILLFENHLCLRNDRKADWENCY